MRTQHMLHKTKHKTVNITQNPRFGHRVGGTLLKVLVSREVLRMTLQVYDNKASNIVT